MRGWILLFEVALSIIILITFYFYLINQNFYKEKNIFIDEEEFRYLDFSCNNSYIYYITNFTEKVFCYKGNKLSEIPDNVTKIFEYFYAGKEKYEPFLIILYK